MKQGEDRYDYSNDIESVVDMRDSTDGLGIELTTLEVVLRLNQLEAELATCRERIVRYAKERVAIVKAKQALVDALLAGKETP